MSGIDEQLAIIEDVRDESLCVIKNRRKQLKRYRRIMKATGYNIAGMYIYNTIMGEVSEI